MGDWFKERVRSAEFGNPTARAPRALYHQPNHGLRAPFFVGSFRETWPAGTKHRHQDVISSITNSRALWGAFDFLRSLDEQRREAFKRRPAAAVFMRCADYAAEAFFNF